MAKKILLALIFALSFLGPVVSLDATHLLHAPLYHFFHAHPLHAGINLYVFWQVCRILQPSQGRMLVAYAIATLIPPVLLTTPIVGMSAFIYALLGLLTPLVARKRYYVRYIVFFIALQIIIPHIAWQVHLYAFLAGLLLVLPDCRR